MLDLLTSKGHVRQWTLVDGEPRCEADALDPRDPLAATAYGRSLFIADLIARADAGVDDEDAASLRRLRVGEGSEDDSALLALLVDDADPVAPPIAAPNSISDRQFSEGLWDRGIITAAEHLAFVTVGALPAALNALVEAIPDENARVRTRGLIAGATVFNRQHPLVALVAAGMNPPWSDQQVDAFWAECAAL